MVEFRASTEIVEAMTPQASDSEDVAIFVAEMSAELARMAKGARFDMLAQFLTMARVEAEMLVRLRQVS
jgi:hypothetical protein